jgi:hypothetical protein
MWGHKKKVAIFKPGREPLADKESMSTLVLDFQDSRSVKNKCFLLKPPVYGILL